MPGQRKAWTVLMVSVLLVAGCASTDKTLQPPDVQVFKPPEIWVTHVPTVPIATELAEAEATIAPATDRFQPDAGPTFDEQQYLLDEIDYLFNDIESTLNGTNTNP